MSTAITSLCWAKRIAFDNQFYDIFVSIGSNDPYIPILKDEVNKSAISLYKRKKKDNKHLNSSLPLISNTKKKIFEDKQKLFYIFQNVPKDTFLNQYAGLISYKIYRRGDKLIIQNTLYSGVFLIQDGEFEVYSLLLF